LPSPVQLPEVAQREALARLVAEARPAILMVTHGWGGGVRRHVDELARLVGGRFLVLHLAPAGPGHVALRGGDGTVALHFALPGEVSLLVELLHALGVVRIHFHHVHGHAPAVLSLPQALGVAYDWTLHDYTTICPQRVLATPEGGYCGEPGPAGCDACLAVRPAPWGTDIASWRALFAASLAGAARRIAPIRDVAARVSRHFPGLAFDVWPHPEPELALPPRAARVALLGHLAPEKGLALAVGCARDAAARGLPLAFRVVGSTGAPLPEARTAPIGATGGYDDADLAELLAREAPDAFLFPAQVPETWS
jgi:glycosyltransferase involved in cell wall biosynthesis